MNEKLNECMDITKKNITEKKTPTNKSDYSVSILIFITPRDTILNKKI